MRVDRVLLGGVVAAALAFAPMTPASAHGWHGHRGCWFIGCVIGAVVGTAAVVATAPFAIVAGATSPPPPRYYGPPPGYYPPPPAYYYGPPRYYAPPPPPGYYPPPNYGPGYYQPPPPPESGPPQG